MRAARMAIPDPEWGGDPHAFVAKYDAAGALRWIRQLEAGWISTERRRIKITDRAALEKRSQQRL